MSRETSASESGRVTELLTPLLELFVGKGNVTDDHVVRKLAHLCEYSLLGMELLLFFSPPGKAGRAGFLRSALRAEAHVLFIALIDETLQLFSDRGSLVSDIWLDGFGGIAGILFAVLLLLFLPRFQREHGKSNTVF